MTEAIVMTMALFLVILASTLLTAGVRQFALSRNMLDVPNQRSSHAVPTPRGGGLAIVIVYFVSLLGLWLTGHMKEETAFGIWIAGGLVAFVGFVDDRGGLSPRLRLLGHFLAAAIALYFLPTLSVLNLFGQEVSLGIFVYPLFFLYLVWMLNLYNFMDGINGLAGLQAISFGVGGALLAHLSGRGDLVYLCLLLAAVSAGFLFWNFPRGRIFMGDVGSGFLGIVIGIITLAADPSRELFWALVILMAVFVTDATSTLFLRVLCKERLFEAHKSHGYQIAARLLQSHVKVSSIVALFNVLILLPLASLVVLQILSPEAGIIGAYGACLLCFGLLKRAEHSAKSARTC